MALVAGAAFADAIGPEEVVNHPFESSCFERSPSFGHVAIGGCQVRIRPPWSAQGRIFRFNNLGLRDRDYSPAPPKDTVRILLLGPMFDGLNLNEGQLASRVLEDRLKMMGVKKVEVINGSVSGFFAPRLGEWGVKLIRAYSPDFVVYFEDGDFANHDFLESKLLRIRDNGELSFAASAPANRPPVLLRWLWPAHATQERISFLAGNFFGAWRILRSSTDSRTAAQKFLEPSLGAFRKILGQLHGKQRLIVFVAERSAALTVPHPGTTAKFLNYFTPHLEIPPQLMRTYFQTIGAHTYPVEIGFESPMENRLFFAKHPVSLTSQGANLFAWSSAPWLRREIQDSGKIKLAPSEVPDFFTRLRHNSTLSAHRAEEGKKGKKRDR